VLNRFGEHVLEQDLKRHGVTATLVGKEEFTVALEFTILVTNLMVVIVTVESQFKFVETKAFSVFCVSFCFVQFSDQSIIHSRLLLMDDKQKGTQ
jgi:hypothetical protein